MHRRAALTALVKVLDALDKFIGLRCQECSSEVHSAWLLQEAAAWNDADAGLFEQIEAVECIWLLASLLGCLNGFVWQAYLREQVHRTLSFNEDSAPVILSAACLTHIRRITRNAFHFLESLMDLLASAI